MNKTICAAFCGTGKSYLCHLHPEKYIEFECWKYSNNNHFPSNYIRNNHFPSNYIRDILNSIRNDSCRIFISTNPIVLKTLYKEGLNIKLIYPDISLKEEYFKRFTERKSSPDFLITLDKYWHKWISELREQTYCERVELKFGQYLQDVI
jgi:hypothetical protein